MPRLLVESKSILFPQSFSRDGKWLAYTEFAESAGDIYIVSIENDGAGLRAGKPEPFIKSAANEGHGMFSPDGRWIAYDSNKQTGTTQVYVRSFLNKEGSDLPVSREGGSYPAWAQNGRELFFKTLDNRIMVVNYTATAEAFTLGRPRPWSPTRLSGPPGVLSYDFHPDGKRIAALMRADTDATSKSQGHVTILFNFFDELRRRVPPAGK